MYLLSKRIIIEVSGENRQDFLQSLITNDIKLATPQNLIYTAFLNSAGRFFADFFIFENNQKYFLDCHESYVDDLIKKFNLYKLRSQVLIQKNEGLKVIFSPENLISKYVGLKNSIFKDPRRENFGWRLYVSSADLVNYQTQDDIAYHQRRINFKIPEGAEDLFIDKSFIAEFDFDNLNAVSYNKGCYLGQETTARNHYRGLIRKQIVNFRITNLSSELLNFVNLNSLQIDDEFVKLTNIKGAEIHSYNSSHELKEVGVILSSILDKKASVLEGLALLKIPEIAPDDNSNSESYINKVVENLVFHDNRFLITN